MDTHTTNDELREMRAAQAVDRLVHDGDYLSWFQIGDGLLVGRDWALHESGANAPVGRRYNKAFGGWMAARDWASGLDKASRSHSMWFAGNFDAVHIWHQALPVRERQRLNHPTAIKRRYEADHDQAGEASGGGGKAAQREDMAKLRTEIARLRAALALIQRLAEEGSLVNLKMQGPNIIAQCIVQHARPNAERIAAKIVELLDQPEPLGIGDDGKFVDFPLLKLSVPFSLAQVNAAYRREAKKLHPDKDGGDTEKMAALNVERDAARRMVALWRERTKRAA